MHACLSLALALLVAVAPSASAQPEPKPAPVSLAAFDRFELADARLADAMLGPDGNERARRELQMTLRDRLGPWLAQRNAQPVRGASPHTLRIEPTIEQVDYVDPLVRVAVGPVAGPERLHVRIRLVDTATGQAVVDTLLRADGSMLAGMAPLGATSSALPERIADALAELLESGVAGDTAPAPPVID
jgi:hypothetical protein